MTDTLTVLAAGGLAAAVAEALGILLIAAAGPLVGAWCYHCGSVRRNPIPEIRLPRRREEKRPAKLEDPLPVVRA